MNAYPAMLLERSGQMKIGTWLLFGALATCMHVGRDSVAAEQTVMLIAIASQPGYGNEYFVLMSSDSTITWRYVLPGWSHESEAPPFVNSTEWHGVVKGNPEDLAKAYHAVKRLDNGEEIGHRVGSLAQWFTLMLVDSSGVHASWPLNADQRKALVAEKDLGSVFKDIQSHQFLGKANLMTDLVFPNRGRHQSTATVNNAGNVDSISAELKRLFPETAGETDAQRADRLKRENDWLTARLNELIRSERR